MGAMGHDITMTDEIKSFRGEYRWLSNFWMSGTPYKGNMYPSVEHAFQAAKATDEINHDWVAQAEKPGQAKRRGRQVLCRPDWEVVKLRVMAEAVWGKFTHSPVLAQKLLATGNAHLEEGNTHGDEVWGTVKGRGENYLGKILMRVRDKLRERPA